MPPLFGDNEGPVDVALGQIDVASFSKILSQCCQYSFKGTGADPLLKASMDGLIGRVASGQIFPWSSGSKNPEDTVEDIASRPPGAAFAVITARGIRNEAGDILPLSVGDIHDQRSF